MTAYSKLQNEVDLIQYARNLTEHLIMLDHVTHAVERLKAETLARHAAKEEDTFPEKYSWHWYRVGRMKSLAEQLERIGGHVFADSAADSILDVHRAVFYQFEYHDSEGTPHDQLRRLVLEDHEWEIIDKYELQLSPEGEN